MNSVFVTGAGGKTGQMVLEKLRQRPKDFRHVGGLVRRPEQAAQLGPGMVVGDILSPGSWEDALQGVSHLVILTSAVPKPRPGADPTAPYKDPENDYYFEPGQEPEKVDWEGQCNQIDAAKQAGVGHVVLVSSVGVTKPGYPLNRMGRGNILVHKARAEEYLVQSGLPYTIIHPGGLIDQPGGRRQLVVGHGDEFMDTPGAPRSIPRDDLAEAVVQALLLKEAVNKSFDLAARPEEEGGLAAATDWRALYEQA